MMKKHPMLALASALLLAAVACVDAEQADTTDDATAVAEAPPAPAPAAAPAEQTPAAPAQAPAARTKFVPPIRGQAELGFMKPVTKREKNGDIVTVIKVKNLSTTGSIAGLKVDEYWYDKAGDPVSGDTFRYRKPLMPGEVIDVTLRTPYNPKMDRNSYNFSHANGEIKTKSVPKF
jgi:hypothetical protein